MKKLIFIILGLILAISISSVYGLSNLTINPSDPKIGDTITITGKADPNEEINCKIWFEIDPLVAPPYYGYIMNNVDIPTTPNSFKIVAENVNSLSISIKLGIWVNRRVEANSEGIAVISKSNIPPGTYDIKMGGTIKDPEKPVKLKIFASTKIKADENGNFKYSYRVNNIPEGTVIHLNIGGIKRDIVIKSSIPTPPPVDIDDETEKNDDSTENRDNTPIPTKDVEKDHLNTPDNTNRDSQRTTPENRKISKEKDNNKSIDRRDTEGKDHNISPNYQYTDKKKEHNHNITGNVSHKSKEDRIIRETIVKNIGSAILIIPNGTKIGTEEKIFIKEISIPNTTLAYYISPKKKEFNKPLILKIPYNISQHKRITVLYYDEHLKRWINIPYTYNENTITVKISRSGYYAIKEEEYLTNIEKENESILDKLYSIIDLFRIIITLLLNYLQNLFK